MQDGESACSAGHVVPAGISYDTRIVHTDERGSLERPREPISKQIRTILFPDRGPLNNTGLQKGVKTYRVTQVPALVRVRVLVLQGNLCTSTVSVRTPPSNVGT